MLIASRFPLLLPPIPSISMPMHRAWRVDSHIPFTRMGKDGASRAGLRYRARGLKKDGYQELDPYTLFESGEGWNIKSGLQLIAFETGILHGVLSPYTTKHEYPTVADDPAAVRSSELPENTWDLLRRITSTASRCTSLCEGMGMRPDGRSNFDTIGWNTKFDWDNEYRFEQHTSPTPMSVIWQTKPLHWRLWYSQRTTTVSISWKNRVITALQCILGISRKKTTLRVWFRAPISWQRIRVMAAQCAMHPWDIAKEGLPDIMVDLLYSADRISLPSVLLSETSDFDGDAMVMDESI